MKTDDIVLVPFPFSASVRLNILRSQLLSDPYFKAPAESHTSNDFTS